MKANQTKFRELVLYISARSTHDPRFGAVKLNKLLYFCDFSYYMKTGNPITGVPYFRLGNGPAPRCLLPVRDEMIAQGILHLEYRTLKSGFKQERTVPDRAPDLSVFPKAEIEHAASIIDRMWEHDADAISDLSHRDIGWKVMRQKENIPYPMAFYSNPPLTEDEIARGKEIAARRSARHAA